MGQSHRCELRSRLGVILEHFLKLEHSPAAGPQHGWMDTIERKRSEIELLLEQSPSLRGEVTQMVPDETRPAIRHAARALRRYGEATPEALTKFAVASYSQEQVLGDWYPGDTPRPDPLPASAASGERERNPVSGAKSAVPSRGAF